MIKEHFVKLTSYNVWANKKCFQFINEAGVEALDKSMISSFSSIRKTVCHIFDAETIWMQRINNESNIVWPASAKFETDFTSFEKAFITSSEAVTNYAKNLSEGNFETILVYKNVAGKEFSNSIKDILTHVMNHSTYHRGQLVTLLRNAGYTQLSSLDFITFCRE